MKAGRHRAFEKAIALDQAMQTFWRMGYSGTSLSDLTAAMGINKPSLYSVFGNKEALFKSCLKRYVEKHGVTHADYLSVVGESLSDRLRNYLISIADMLTDPTLPGGCFICSSTNEYGGKCIPSEASHTILSINEETKSSLTRFFEGEIAAGNLTSETSPAVVADYIISLQLGMAVMARNGTKLNELKDMINLSIKHF